MNIQQIAKFVSAGYAKFLLTDYWDGSLYKYKVVRDNDTDKIWYVSVLVQVGGERDYGYLGMIRGGEFVRTAGSFVDEEDSRFSMFDWFFLQMARGHELPDEVEFMHIGRCGRCGKELTDAKSKAIGLGPVCRGDK